MAHFYDCTKLLSPVLKKEITTPSGAKKDKGKVYPSITTLLGSTIKDPFLDSYYRPSKMVELARMNEHFDKHWKEIEQLCYGTIEAPDGELVPSSVFGTGVHKSLEKMLNAFKYGDNYEWDMYDPWGYPFMDWVEREGYDVMACELAIGDGLVKTCGTIDVVLRDLALDQIFICDYKCRKRKQFYDKDLWQMAIECYMLKRRYKLDYLPLCMSVCIDISTKEHHHKWWTLEQMEEAIEIVKLISKIYWKTRMK